MTQVRQTSIMAFNHILDEGKIKTQKDKVYYCLVTHPEGLSRWDIHKIAGLMYSSTCARVNSLIKGKEAVELGIKLNDSGEKAAIVTALPSRRLDYIKREVWT